MLGKNREHVKSDGQKSVKPKVTFFDVLIPVLGLIILGLLTYFVYIPMVNSAREMRNEIKEVKSKQGQMEDLKARLAEVDEFTMQQDLTTAKKVIPTQLEVADFAYYIDTLAKEKNLELKDISAGDVLVSFNSSGEISNNKSVSGPLSYDGTSQEIIDFLDDLQVYSPYIISVNGIYLQKVALEGVQVLDGSFISSTDKWQLEIDVTGHYVGKSSTPEKINIYDPFTPYTQNQTVIDIFKSKAEKFSTNP